MGDRTNAAYARECDRTGAFPRIYKQSNLGVVVGNAPYKISDRTVKTLYGEGKGPNLLPSKDRTYRTVFPFSSATYEAVLPSQLQPRKSS